jgi:hypothetical protein
LTAAVIGTTTHWAAQVPALTSSSGWQAFVGTQLIGQAFLLVEGKEISQISPRVGSSAPSPHLAEQSGSFEPSQPSGQQPSFCGEHSVTIVVRHWALQ